MSQRDPSTITTLDKLNMLTDFLERKNLWEGEYPINYKNFDMHYYHDFNAYPECGTVGCIAGHMGVDSIWKSMGYACAISEFPTYHNRYDEYALGLLLGITPQEANCIFYGYDIKKVDDYSDNISFVQKSANFIGFPKTVEEAIARINQVKERYK